MHDNVSPIVMHNLFKVMNHHFVIIVPSILHHKKALPTRDTITLLSDTCGQILKPGISLKEWLAVDTEINVILSDNEISD